MHSINPPDTGRLIPLLSSFRQRWINAEHEITQAPSEYISKQVHS